ncbi:YciI family protein [Leifsonia sp. AG29]|uniref:YciI family protein n=1 Tax=Leifsonia sp. AG29 TaxID=2598860 RepID=UPI00131BFB48|nr:YciI family protein [Leifsonia sp. AG29]
MYAVSFYDPDPESTPERFARIAAAYPRHRAYLDEFAASGDVLMIGAFGDPQAQGSMAIFRSREAAERFRDGDPFVTEGLVYRSRILDWDPLIFAGG